MALHSKLLIMLPAAGGGATYTLNAAAGTYSISGAAAGLLADRILNAEPGSYALSGSAADLIYTPVAPTPPVTTAQPFEAPGGGSGGLRKTATQILREREDREFMEALPVILSLISRGPNDRLH